MSVALTRNQLTPVSKALLRKTVRELRESLIAKLKESAEQRYLLSLPMAKAAAILDAGSLEQRRRLEAALEQAAEEEGGGKEARARAFEAAAKEAGATLLNRLVLIRHLEALGLSKPAVLTGGWMSKGYQEFQQVAAALCEDETQGMSPLLDLLFAELAVALPGLFGDVGLTSLLPVAPATLRHVIEALDEVPVEAWCDDLTLGWVYQFWNDPDREALDAKINASGKIEPHEIASKTQMFTERYMVEWLLQNSLGPTWLAMCKKHGWTAEAESTGVLAQLDARRADWRKKRAAQEVAADAPMPIIGPLEEAWKYYVPQPMSAAVVEHAPDTLKDLKLLDPACGSGHFLVVAFDLLVELYREEARHRGQSWSDREIAEWILENNLHGIDIDPRAVQIAAAAMYLKARALAKDVNPRQVNLVAPMLKLSALKANDPGLVALETDIQKETGIPPELTRQLIATLEGVDHLGSLLKVGDAVDKALEAHEGTFARDTGQRELFEKGRAPDPKPLKRDAAKKIVRQRIEGFLAKHAGAEDLGLRLRGQQLTAGLRFASIARESEYHLVVGNPPYQNTSRLADATYVARHYPSGRSDLYAAFLERGIQLCRPGGASAMVTMRNWMFLGGYAEFRTQLRKTADLRILGDLNRGAFEEVPDEVVATVMSVFRRLAPGPDKSIAIQPTALNDAARDSNRTMRKRLALLVQLGRFEFRSSDFEQVDGEPLVYWWSREFIELYASTPKLSEVGAVRQGLTTSNNSRFVRFPWEVSGVALRRESEAKPEGGWVPYIKGARGAEWFEPVSFVVDWRNSGLAIKVLNEFIYGSYTRSVRSESRYFEIGSAFTTMGSRFGGRSHRFRSICDAKGRTVYGMPHQSVTCLLNSAVARRTVESLNPTVDFAVGDVNRLPVFPIAGSEKIFAVLEEAFQVAESGREPSVEFREPCASYWPQAQKWAQEGVDRAPGVALLTFLPVPNAPNPIDHLSYEVGRALGRFPIRSSPSTGDVLPNGILFVSPRNFGDSVELPACRALRSSWEQFGEGSLRAWLRKEFWAHHREIYSSRPIYFPLSSSKRSFLAYVSIHRWTASTLTTLLSEYLFPERKLLEGSIADLRATRTNGDKKSRSETERQFAEQTKWLEELEEFIVSVAQCAEKGPPQPDGSTPAREIDNRHLLDPDDGVMVNAAALWPLLDPMWKDPKKWWKELAAARGSKDHDWSHLAARYFPSRVDEKCKKDPSLAVAHGCFWKYHPVIAYQWELRLQNEMGPDFLINEKDSDALRKAFLKKESKRAAELQAAEKVRRERKANKQDQEDLELDTAEDADDEGEAA